MDYVSLAAICVPTYSTNTSVERNEIIDFLRNCEETHNQMFRDTFNKVQKTGSKRDFRTIKAAKMYFSMSEPAANAFGARDTHVPAFK